MCCVVVEGRGVCFAGLGCIGGGVWCVVSVVLRALFLCLNARLIVANVAFKLTLYTICAIGYPRTCVCACFATSCCLKRFFEFLRGVLPVCSVLLKCLCTLFGIPIMFSEACHMVMACLVSPQRSTNTHLLSDRASRRWMMSINIFEMGSLNHFIENLACCLCSRSELSRHAFSPHGRHLELRRP